MIATHMTEDRMIDLAHGLLDPTDASACTDHLGRCTSCESRFREIAGEHARLLAEHAGPVETRRTWIAAGAAAAVLLVAAIVWSVAPRGETRPAPWWLPTVPGAAVLRSTDGAPSPGELASALEAYAGRDAARAVALLETAQIPPELEGLRDLYLASALEHDGNPEEAEGVLRRLQIETLPEPWRSRARWIDYTVALRLGRITRARELLDRLVAAEGTIGDLARDERARRERAP